MGIQVEVSSGQVDTQVWKLGSFEAVKPGRGSRSECEHRQVYMSVKGRIEQGKKWMDIMPFGPKILICWE